MKRVNVLVLATLIASSAACGRKEPPPAGNTQGSAPAPSAGSKAPVVPVASLPDIDRDALLRHIQVLSSDKFEGRAPGTRGEELSVAYLETQFRDLGLQPGNPDGTFIQKVPLVGITGVEAKPLTFVKGAKALGMK